MSAVEGGGVARVARVVCEGASTACAAVIGTRVFGPVVGGERGFDMDVAVAVAVAMDVGADVAVCVGIGAAAGRRGVVRAGSGGAVSIATGGVTTILSGTLTSCSA
ncbi:hypothetical protein [Pararobbsia silviterrae]|uniref:hypothetical protein n=1 Tax=Pararobbsia silviterrae TaxID=1792498 RepID=UPI0011C3C96D|nr:hypothetical protein [Pararobbsia silviterrae]